MSQADFIATGQSVSACAASDTADAIHSAAIPNTAELHTELALFTKGITFLRWQRRALSSTH
jgi:hypothetical protein